MVERISVFEYDCYESFRGKNVHGIPFFLDLVN